MTGGQRGGVICSHRVSGRDPHVRGFDAKVRGRYFASTSKAQRPLYLIVEQAVNERGRRQERGRR